MEKMNIVFAIVSVIILYPILSVLPFGIKAKQKLFLLIISLLISIVGILSVNLLPFWQTLLLMVAFSGLASILVSKRMPENSVKILGERNDFFQEKRLFNNEHSTNEQSNLDEINELANVKVESVEDMEDLVSTFDIEPFVTENLYETIEQIENSVEGTYESLYEELHTDLFVASTLESLEEEKDIEKLDNIEENININDIEQLESTQYLSEIEKLLLEAEFNSLIAKEEKVIPIVGIKNVPAQKKEIKLEELY
jgi:type I site-specific restriction-modification system R (restriction) subunit